MARYQTTINALPSLMHTVRAFALTQTGRQPFDPRVLLAFIHFAAFPCPSAVCSATTGLVPRISAAFGTFVGGNKFGCGRRHSCRSGQIKNHVGC